MFILWYRYDTRNSHKTNHNHQGHRGKKNDNDSGSLGDERYTRERGNRSNEKVINAEALAKDIELASTIRPQGEHIFQPFNTSNWFCDNGVNSFIVIIFLSKIENLLPKGDTEKQ